MPLWPAFLPGKLDNAIRVEVSTTQDNFNIFTAAGSPTAANVTVIVNLREGALLRATTTANYALSRGTGWGANSRVEVHMFGSARIIGAGGDGGDGGLLNVNFSGSFGYTATLGGGGGGAGSVPGAGGTTPFISPGQTTGGDPISDGASGTENAGGAGGVGGVVNSTPGYASTAPTAGGGAIHVPNVSQDIHLYTSAGSSGIVWAGGGGGTASGGSGLNSFAGAPGGGPGQPGYGPDPANPAGFILGLGGLAGRAVTGSGKVIVYGSIDMRGRDQ